MKFIDNYDDDTLWDELGYRLSLRDLVKDLGEEKYKEMTPEERIVSVSRLEDKYHEEFEKNGLENIIIKA